MLTLRELEDKRNLNFQNVMKLSDELFGNNVQKIGVFQVLIEFGSSKRV